MGYTITNEGVGGAIPVFSVLMCVVLNKAVVFFFF